MPVSSFSLLLVASVFVGSAADSSVAGQGPARYAGGVSVTQLVDAASWGMPGMTHATAHGMHLHRASDFEMWIQTLEPGASTPIHRHTCEEAVFVMEGEGELLVRENPNSKRRRAPKAIEVGPNDTMAIAADVVHQIRNIGSGPLRVLATLSGPPMSMSVYKEWDTCDGSGVCRGDPTRQIVETETWSPLPWDQAYGSAVGVPSADGGTYNSYVEQRRRERAGEAPIESEDDEL